ncbi:unnamed protein product [Prunus armeniaca]|uniref:Uncharacterized protein n=1 Tax=Prunus armeniaca TaxID=36596 RepID=A0A6J5UPY2_PRUAR|nr:unnamed protein product [Prunus armeniaca]CAB4309052.1 unnamed protein product [Prunus armeniaca]
MGCLPKTQTMTKHHGDSYRTAGPARKMKRSPPPDSSCPRNLPSSCSYRTAGLCLPTLKPNSSLLNENDLCVPKLCGVEADSKLSNSKSYKELFILSSPSPNTYPYILDSLTKGPSLRGPTRPLAKPHAAHLLKPGTKG